MNLADARVMAEELIQQHCPHYTFHFNNQKRTFGICKYHDQRIELSRVHTQLEPEEKVRNTILHEIAHAIAGHENGHNRVWKSIARSIGHTTPPRSTRAPHDHTQLPYKWAMMHGDDIVQGYYRRPGPSTFAQVHLYWVKGKPHTRGQLRLVEL